MNARGPPTGCILNVLTFGELHDIPSILESYGQSSYYSFRYKDAIHSCEAVISSVPVQHHVFRLNISATAANVS